MRDIIIIYNASILDFAYILNTRLSTVGFVHEGFWLDILWFAIMATRGWGIICKLFLRSNIGAAGFCAPSSVGVATIISLSKGSWKPPWELPFSNLSKGFCKCYDKGGLVCMGSAGNKSHEFHRFSFYLFSELLFVIAL